MWKFLKPSDIHASDESIQFISSPSTRLIGEGKEEGSHGRLSARFSYGSTGPPAVPMYSHGPDGPPRPNWWKRKRQMIFRKKTLHKKFPIILWLPKYTFQDGLADLVAGITVGVTVIPQALAYATVAGLPPQYGLYSAFIGCFIYVLLGSAQAITIGPTALLALLTYNGATQMGPGAAILLAFLSGCIELALGLLNLGFLIEFIAGPVIAGFTTASAFTIATTQVKSLLGLKFNADGFIATWAALFDHIDETRLWDAVMGFSSIVALLLLRFMGQIKLSSSENPSCRQKFGQGFIWLLSTSRNAVVILICSVIAAVLVSQGYDDTVLLTGNITAGLPTFQPPPFFIEYSNQTFNFAEICQNLGSAIVVTPLIGILESVAIAKSFAKGQKIDASQEMIAIGASNIIGSFVSSFPVTGSFSRTAVNAASGVHTPLGGIFTGSLVLLATSVLTPYFYFIPKSSLAAVICTAVIAMVEVHLVKLVWRSRKIDLIPLLVTFLVCLLFSLEYGILIGTAVNLAMLLYSTSRPRIKITHIKATSSVEFLLITPDRSLVFSAMDYFMSAVRKASAEHRKPHPLPIVIDLSHVSMADFSTAYGFNLLSEDMYKKGHQVIVSRTQTRVLNTLLGVGPNHLKVHHEGSNIIVLLEGLKSDDGAPHDNIAVSIDTSQP